MPVTDFPDWNAPQAHADDISTTGAPPLVMKRVIDALIGQNVGTSSSITRPASGKFSVNQPGYEILLNVATLGASAPIMSVELQWYDSGFGGLVDSEIYYFYSGDLNGHLVHGRGPSKGDQVVVIITNFSGASAVTVSYTLLQTSRTFTREFWKTIGKGGVQPAYPGFTAAKSSISANVLTNDSFMIAASSSKVIILPLYTGSVSLMGITSDTVAGNSTWDVIASSDQVVPSAVPFEGVNGQSGFAPLGVKSLYGPNIPLPRSQCQLTLLNGNASSPETLSSIIIAGENRA